MYLETQCYCGHVFDFELPSRANSKKLPIASVGLAVGNVVCPSCGKKFRFEFYEKWFDIEEYVTRKNIDLVQERYKPRESYEKKEVKVIRLTGNAL